MNICENCGTQHDSSYGSGRFCSSKCARAFSTKEKRQEINEKVSKKIKELESLGLRPKGKPFQKGKDIRRECITKETRQKANATRRGIRNAKYADAPWKELPKYIRRERIINEQNGKCAECGIDSWNGKQLTLEIHHIDGNRDNNSRENQVGLCPNCHSQTDNFKRRKCSLK